MNTRMHPGNTLSAWAGMAAIHFILLLAALSAHAQQVSTLIEFTNVWKYDRSGVDLGTQWRTNGYDDSAWPEGQAMFGYEPDAAAIAGYNGAMGILPTTTPFTTAFPQSTTVVTYYFRTMFNFTGTLPGLSLIASNLLDDGLVIYLNGVEVGRQRVANNQISGTPASGGPASEGAIEPLVLSKLDGAVREGENLLAVEVHNLMSGAYDMAFGMKLVAIQQTPLVITNPPQSQTVTAGEPVVLTVGVEGGPVSYRWQKDGVNLTSTSNSLRIASAQPANAGGYRVICSNALTVVTSSVATLTVFADLTAPTATVAIVEDRFGPGTINILFSESLTSASALNIGNYTVTRLGSGNTVTITNLLYNSMLGVLLRLDLSDADWVPYADYVVTINHVTDTRTNVIAPNTTVPVSWAYATNLLQSSQSWDFHVSAIFEPEIFDEAWFTPDYVPGPWWGQGSGPFYGGFNAGPLCSWADAPQTITGWQPEPILYRTTISYPAHWPSNATLRLRTASDDGLVLYLNGVEIYRYNVFGPGSPVGASTRSISSIQVPLCITNISIAVTNLRPGLNYLAAAVVQSSTGASDADAYFVLEADAVIRLSPVLPPEPLPVLQATSLDTNSLRLSWTGGGYALESSTNLDLGPASYPLGPWTPVPQMSNPFLWNFTNGPARFFRLKK